MTQQEEFGRRLRQLRREKSATEARDVEQEEVAEAIGDKQPNLARWEKGRIPKEDSTVRALAEYYGVAFVWLRHGEGVKKPIAPSGRLAPDPRAGAEQTAKSASAKKRQA